MVAPFAPFVVSAAIGLAKGVIDQVAGPSDSDARGPAETRARKTASDFEAMFLEQSLDQVFASVGQDGPLGENGTGGSVYRSMLVKEYAGTIVKSGGVGIGEQVFREIMRLQEGASHA
jgi:Rod binding domain-containing protein